MEWSMEQNLEWNRKYELITLFQGYLRSLMPPLVLQLLSCGFVFVLYSSRFVFVVSDSPIILIICVTFHCLIIQLIMSALIGNKEFVSCILIEHYENLPMQYTEIFFSRKN